MAPELTFTKFRSRPGLENEAQLHDVSSGARRAQPLAQRSQEQGSYAPLLLAYLFLAPWLEGGRAA